MSLTVNAYLVELFELQTLYASRNVTVLRNIEHSFETILHEDETALTVEGEISHVPTLRQALRAIIAGEIPAKSDGSRYGYALELVCQYLGQALPNEHFTGFQGMSVLKGFPGLMELVGGWKPPIPIPRPKDAFSMTYVTKKDAAVYLAQTPKVELFAPYNPQGWHTWDLQTQVAYSEEWEKRLHKQYRDWLEEAVRSAQDIVATLY